MLEHFRWSQYCNEPGYYYTLVKLFLNVLKLGFSKVFLLHALRDFINSDIRILFFKEVCVF